VDFAGLVRGKAVEAPVPASVVGASEGVAVAEGTADRIQARVPVGRSRLLISLNIHIRYN
jgi:hypothetical protein